MSYRRRNSWQNNLWDSGKTKVHVHWSNKSSAYSVMYSNIGNNFGSMQVLNNFIKNLPMGERDVQMDDSSGKKVWTWYFAEQHLDAFKALFDSFSAANIFEWDFIGKPANQGFQHTFVSMDTYFTTFSTTTGTNIKNMEYADAKKVYRRWVMQNHPDKGGDPLVVSKLNEAWTELELKHYKTKKEIVYEATEQTSYQTTS